MEMLENNKRRKESTYKSFNSNGIGRTLASPVCTASAHSQMPRLSACEGRSEKSIINAALALLVIFSENQTF